MSFDNHEIEKLPLQVDGFLASHPLLTHISYKNIELFDFEKFKQGIPDKNISDDRLKMNLGRRAEMIFHGLLDFHSDYNIITAHEQIIQDKATLGELDFIIEKDEQKSHIELAYKIYLYDPNKSTTSINNWIGPNRKDSLIQKVNKLYSQQFPLLYNTATTEQLKELGIEISTVKQELLLLGQLYLPHQEQVVLNPNINPKAVSGYWCTFDQFKNQEHDEVIYFAPNKEDWLISPSDFNKWEPYDTILHTIEAHHKEDKSPMLWYKEKNGFIGRMFVVWWS